MTHSRNSVSGIAPRRHHQVKEGPRADCHWHRFEAAYIDEHHDEMARHGARLDGIAERLADELERRS